MKLRARIDKNHKSIVECFRKLGCSVLSLSSQGKGCPDLLISYQKQCYLVEVKDTGGKLRESQKAFMRNWGSPVYVVHSTNEVVSLLNKLRRADDPA
jgi:Holliday junction resolvase